MQLVRLSLLELAGQETAVTQREALRDRIRAYVARHLRDPQLSIDGIARALNCSQRHLYNAFAGGRGHRWPATSSASAWKPACATCARARHGTRPITDIALSWGFSTPRTSAACSASTWA